MTRPPRFPQEILDKILDQAEDAVLSNAALVSKPWRARSQARQFSYVWLKTEARLASFGSRILRPSPHIVHYIKHLRLGSKTIWWSTSPPYIPWQSFSSLIDTHMTIMPNVSILSLVGISIDRREEGRFIRQLIASAFPSLSSISFNRCQFSRTLITRLLCARPDMKELSIQCCKTMFDLDPFSNSTLPLPDSERVPCNLRVITCDNRTDHGIFNSIFRYVLAPVDGLTIRFVPSSVAMEALPLLPFVPGFVEVSEALEEVCVLGYDVFAPARVGGISIPLPEPLPHFPALKTLTMPLRNFELCLEAFHVKNPTTTTRPLHTIRLLSPMTKTKGHNEHFFGGGNRDDASEVIQAQVSKLHSLARSGRVQNIIISIPLHSPSDKDAGGRRRGKPMYSKNVFNGIVIDGVSLEQLGSKCVGCRIVFETYVVPRPEFPAQVALRSLGFRRSPRIYPDSNDSDSESD